MNLTDLLNYTIAERNQIDPSLLPEAPEKLDRIEWLPLGKLIVLSSLKAAEKEIKGMTSNQLNAMRETFEKNFPGKVKNKKQVVPVCYYAATNILNDSTTPNMKIVINPTRISNCYKFAPTGFQITMGKVYSVLGYAFYTEQKLSSNIDIVVGPNLKKAKQFFELGAKEKDEYCIKALENFDTTEPSEPDLEIEKALLGNLGRFDQKPREQRNLTTTTVTETPSEKKSSPKKVSAKKIPSPKKTSAKKIVLNETFSDTKNVVWTPFGKFIVLCSLKAGEYLTNNWKDDEVTESKKIFTKKVSYKLKKAHAKHCYVSKEILNNESTPNGILLNPDPILYCFRNANRIEISKEKAFAVLGYAFSTGQKLCSNMDVKLEKDLDKAKRYYELGADDYCKKALEILKNKKDDFEEPDWATEKEALKKTKKQIEKQPDEEVDLDSEEKAKKTKKVEKRSNSEMNEDGEIEEKTKKSKKDRKRSNEKMNKVREIEKNDKKPKKFIPGSPEHDEKPIPVVESQPKNPPKVIPGSPEIDDEPIPVVEPKSLQKEIANYEKLSNNVVLVLAQLQKHGHKTKNIEWDLVKLAGTENAHEEWIQFLRNCMENFDITIQYHPIFSRMVDISKEKYQKINWDFLASFSIPADLEQYAWDCVRQSGFGQ